MRKLNSLRSIIGGIFFIIAVYGKAQENFAQKIEQTAASSILKYTTEFTDSFGNSAKLPIVIVKGKQQGRILTVLAGVHGYEYPPIMAVQSFLKEVNPEDLKGTIIILPIANTAAFYGRSLFVNPLDGANLNNAFPGKEDGTITQQIAHFITKNIIPPTDVFLDIHGGDASEDLIPFVCYYNHKGKSEATELAKKLSKTSGFANVVSYPYTIEDDEPAKYAFKQAVQDGKVGLSFEAGKLANVQEDAVVLNKNGIYNVLNALDMYTSNFDIPEKLELYDNQVYIKIPATGIFYSDLYAGEPVKKGQKIGVITNEFGELLEKVLAPESGTILYKIGTPPVTKGETLMCIGIPVK
ncbi:succinylglutamate desuccinylase/aspartoacylase family protein [Flagellimonas sp. CMM7]|uniref:succinylglutamate desuccinylase/aspartoacylase family protein n=1 Tax=Flagellimonas sp. CMM7 TaxID=2654676 RepID=UPI0013D14EB8|nr:M14 family metallopeptidase [Flagellimonas sp. CMM7]UII78331.1 M14 family metallopeptidase [Flagellimonas sp. CMM7]